MTTKKEKNIVIKLLDNNFKESGKKEITLKKSSENLSFLYELDKYQKPLN